VGQEQEVTRLERQGGWPQSARRQLPSSTAQKLGWP
jgi:hypothetical protein